jgi:hypothetical protein
VAPLISHAVWWHGLWQVWRALGDAPRADAARASGLAWLDTTRQQHLAVEFHTSFCDHVPAHRELVSGRARTAD